MFGRKKHKHCTPEELYLKMLEIGSKCISCGTNLKEIKTELLSCGLIEQDEDETTLRIIFQNSFTHDETNRYYGEYCKAPEPEFECNPSNKEEYDRLTQAYKDLDHEYECTWFLTPESLMYLTKLKEVKENKQISNNTKYISIASLITALCILGSNLINRSSPGDIFKSTEFENIKTEIELINTNLEGISKSDIQPTTEEDVKSSKLDNTKETELDKINTTLKSINWKLLQIKKEIVPNENE